MGTEDQPDAPLEEAASHPTIREALQSLPLLEDDMYISMQAFSIAVVDKILEGLEQQLLAEMILEESTLFASASVVSGISQLWIFGVYELLRTWRQRARAVLRFGDESRRLPPEQRDARIAEQRERVVALAADPGSADPAHWRAFEQAAKDPEFAARVRSALERSELPFRRLEALRVYLAKHEVPRVKGSYGSSPGYGRINTVTGSIYWQIDLGNMEVDVLARREVADALRELSMDLPCFILPEAAQREVARIPATNYYNFKRLNLVLDDGSEHEALVAFDKQVLGDPGLAELPFDLSRVVGCRPPADAEPSA